jgi:septum formation protein
VENARRKARAGTEMVVRGLQPPKLAGAVGGVAAGAGPVLGVDTEVVLDGRLLGKAPDEAGARERLTALSGRTHEVLSGVVVLGRARPSSRNPASSTLDFVPRGETKSRVGAGATSSVPDAPVTERSGVARSSVVFRELSPELLDAYLASGEWRDRAGAYAVQGLGSALMERVEGDLSNVIGLPVGLLLELAPELFDAAGDSHS